MPFPVLRWSNEKGICAALSFRLLGINSYHNVYAPVMGSEKVSEFMAHGTKELLGSEMIVDVDHVKNCQPTGRRFQKNAKR